MKAIYLSRLRFPESTVLDEILAKGQECKEFMGFWSADVLKRIANSPNGVCLIAEIGDRVDRKLIGFSLGTFQTITRKFQWENLWVHPNYRHDNLGTTLTNETIATAKKIGAGIIAADVLSKVASKILIKKFSFKAQGSFHYLLL